MDTSSILADSNCFTLSMIHWQMIHPRHQVMLHNPIVSDAPLRYMDENKVYEIDRSLSDVIFSQADFRLQLFYALIFNPCIRSLVTIFGMPGQPRE